MKSLFFIIVLIVPFLMSCGSDSATSGSERRGFEKILPSRQTVLQDTDESSIFSIIVYPDSQNEVDDIFLSDQGSSNSIWEVQNQWVVNHKDLNNIVAVIGVGDITNFPFDDSYEIAKKNGYELIDQANIPYLPLMGNHDWNFLAGRNSSTYDQHFGPSYFKEKQWYVDGFPKSVGGYSIESNANMAISLDVEGCKFLVIGLEIIPRIEAVAWAQNLIDNNPDRKIIIVTHAYLTHWGELYVDDNEYSTKAFGLPPSLTYNGYDLWNNFIKLNKNIVMVICGHDICYPYISVNKVIGENDNSIVELFTNYQCSESGGDGYITILKFKTTMGILEINSFSTNKNLFDDVGTYTVPIVLD